MKYIYQLERDINGELGWLRACHRMGGRLGSRWAMRQYVTGVIGDVRDDMQSTVNACEQAVMRYYPA